MKKQARFFKALADETRLQILWLLVGAEELCVCDIMRALGITQSKASRHLRYLFNVGLVSDRRWGQWITTGTIGEWTPDNIVEWRGVLTLPPELPAGDYRLWAGLQRPTETTPFAEFSISTNDPAIVIQP